RGVRVHEVRAGRVGRRRALRAGASRGDGRVSAWKAARADALDAEAQEITATLERLEVVEELLEAAGSAGPLHEVRAVQATLRSERSARQAEAKALRPAPPGTLPLALTAGGPTVRRVPRRREEVDDAS